MILKLYFEIFLCYTASPDTDKAVNDQATYVAKVVSCVNSQSKLSCFLPKTIWGNNQMFQISRNLIQMDHFLENLLSIRELPKTKQVLDDIGFSPVIFFHPPLYYFLKSHCS